MAGLAVVMTLGFRWASCSESLWVDELHSAWVAVGPLSEVTTRAAIGNQQPGYFLGLWGWLHAVGESETALRMSSVLASVLASVALAISVLRTTGSVAAGLLAAGFLAIDKDAIFFGCELRPYAWVMLCAAVALLCWSFGLHCVSRVAKQWWRFGIVSSVCAAVLLHPTSLAVMGPFLVLSQIAWWFAGPSREAESETFATSRSPLVCTVAVIAASAVVFGGATMQQAWSHRQRWSGFASADSWSQFLQAWHWHSMLIAPLVVAFVVAVIGWQVRAKSTDQRFCWKTLVLSFCPIVAAAVGIGAILIAAKDFDVPLWQKRYFVAAFPMIIWTVAVLFGFAVEHLLRIAVLAPRSVSASQESAPLSWQQGLVVTLLVGGLWSYALVDQGLMIQLRQGHWPQQLRGESWRQALSLINESSDVVPSLSGEKQGTTPDARDVLWIDGGLIESQFMREPRTQSNTVTPPTTSTETLSPEQMSSELEQYLKFPVTAIYGVQAPIEVFNVYEHESWLKNRLDRQKTAPKRIWLLARSSVDGVQQYVAKLRSLATSDSNREMVITWHQTSRPILVELNFE